ncbi:low affinity iron permease family protein [Candidatus Saccharibacteria bacterium]|jgi:low affinity Fe/Cu permease|nr:low affinity iron permease family protein [Candidatus Saccharibacteria bacterium]
MRNKFRTASNRVSIWMGSPIVFLGAVLIIIVWATSGPAFRYSDTWQLIINTGTTIVTFLMVFLIQNTQNRDTKAIQLKLDELIRVTKGARNTYVGLEDLLDSDLDELEKEFKLLANNQNSLRALNKIRDKIEAASTPHGTITSAATSAASSLLRATRTIVPPLPGASPVDSKTNKKP